MLSGIAGIVFVGITQAPNMTLFVVPVVYVLIARNRQGASVEEA